MHGIQIKKCKNKEKCKNNEKMQNFKKNARYSNKKCKIKEKCSVFKSSLLLKLTLCPVNTVLQYRIFLDTILFFYFGDTSTVDV